MIKETTKKIEFIPYISKKGKEADINPAPTVNIDRKKSSLYFSKAAVAELQMGGKFMRLYFEPIRKVIGWQLKDIARDHELKTWKLVKLNGSSGAYSCNIKRMLDGFDGRLSQEKYKNVPIQKYREVRQFSEYKDQVFYFVELVDNPEELRKGLGNESLATMSVA